MHPVSSQGRRRIYIIRNQRARAPRCHRDSQTTKIATFIFKSALELGSVSRYYQIVYNICDDMHAMHLSTFGSHAENMKSGWLDGPPLRLRILAWLIKTYYDLANLK